jgi:hypothetical protein
MLGCQNCAAAHAEEGLSLAFIRLTGHEFAAFIARNNSIAARTGPY